MAKERAFTYRNTGTEQDPVWEKWFQKTVADAVLMSDTEGETQTIVDYVNQKIADLIGGAPETYDTLQEIAAYISSHQEVADALTAAIGNKAEKNHTHSEATTTAAGFMSAADKEKLDGIEEELNAKVSESSKGAAGGVAGLDESGKVPLDQLPSSVTDGYTHPKNHPATMITEDTEHRFVTDTEKNAWNAKANLYFASELPESAPAGSVCFLIS